MPDFQTRKFAWTPSPDEVAATPVRHRVIIVGAGPVGLACAIDLAQRGIKVLVLDEDDSLATGSRAICFSRRSLEIFERLACISPILAKGVSWNTGKVFFGERLVYSFDLQPGGDEHYPAFINIQQYYVEAYLLARAAELPALEIRWRNRVEGVLNTRDGAELSVTTPRGRYSLACDYLVAADGSRSSVREILGLQAHGHSFRDRFLIADVRMRAAFPSERWFWFDPPFHRNQSALLHRQPDDVWRIDFQLGWDADPVAEREPGRVRERLRAMLGEAVEFELEWVSVYTFSCVRMERFVHDRVIFIGDAAHSVSPFGARGANGGLQDAENLAWKLAAVLAGDAGPGLLASFDSERQQATDENLLNSTRSTDFITPKSVASRLFRDAVLSLAHEHAFARSLVNSGRLSVPAVLSSSVLNYPQSERYDAGVPPGSVAADAPLVVAGAERWLLELLDGRFCLLVYRGRGRESEIDEQLRQLHSLADQIQVLVVSAEPGEHPGVPQGFTFAHDVRGVLAQRYEMAHGSSYLLRPDQHVCARWHGLQAMEVYKARERALGHIAETA